MSAASNTVLVGFLVLYSDRQWCMWELAACTCSRGPQSRWLGPRVSSHLLLFCSHQIKCVNYDDSTITLSYYYYYFLASKTTAAFTQW